MAFEIINPDAWKKFHIDFPIRHRLQKYGLPDKVDKIVNRYYMRHLFPYKLPGPRYNETFFSDTGLNKQMKKDPDVLLMMQFAAGDEESFRRLFSSYNKKVVNFCFRFCADRAQAEDLAQEVFFRVFRAGRRYRPEARFSTWLFKIAANVCINSARDRKRRPKTISIDRPPSFDDDGPQVDIADTRIPADEKMAERQRHERIREAIRRLPEKQRAALLLRVDADFSYQEIAGQLQCPVNTVRTLIRRGRIRLAEILETD